MIEYREEYGNDCDGNRGMSFWTAELEDSDTQDVAAELEGIGYFEYEEFVEIVINGTRQDYTHSIRPCDWITEEEYNELMKEQ